MMQQELITKNVAAFGEEIGLELGTQMVKAYQVANPTELRSYVIGRNVIDQILAQPGCVGIKFFNAYNENGEKTLVYLGIDARGKAILQYTCVNQHGILENEKGIVADRIPKVPGIPRDEENWWEF